MARVKILKKDGTPTQYFWTDKDGTNPKLRHVYRETTDGVKRLKSVRFNSVTNRVRRRV